MRLAKLDFQHATEALAGERSESHDAKIARLNGLSSYCDAQLAEDVPTSIRCLHRSQEELLNAWERSQGIPEMLSSALALELAHVTDDVMHYEPEVDRRVPSLKAALRLNDSLDTLLNTFERDLGIMLMADLIELNLCAWTNLPEYEEREKAGLRCQQLFERLRTLLSNESVDPRAIAAACSVHLTGMDWGILSEQGWEHPLVDPNSLLPIVEKTGDYVAVGSLHAMSQDINVSTVVLGGLKLVEDPSYAKELVEASERDASLALAGLQRFGGIRRWENSAGKVYHTQPARYYARLFASSQEERRQILRKRVELKLRVGANAPPGGMGAQYSSYSYGLYFRALAENDLDQRKRLLEEAWKAGLGYERETNSFFPYWPQGHADHFILYARVKRELARLVPADRRSALEEAVSTFQKATNWMEQYANSPLIGEPADKHRALAGVMYELGAAQLELYQETRDASLLDKALTNLRKSAQFARSYDAPTRAADVLARIGEAYLLANRFDDARSAFADAAASCRQGTVRYPGLLEVFESQAKLMEGRAAVSTARAAYMKDDFDIATDQFREASRIFDEAKLWPALSTMYYAWGLLSRAEGQSRTQPETAISTLTDAVMRFGEAEMALDLRIGLGRFEDEQSLETQRLLLNHGRRFAEARLLLERARSSERNGRLPESIERLDEAARKFETFADEAVDVETRDSVRTYAKLTRASHAMLEADRSLRPEAYAMAARLFEEAQKTARSRPLALTTAGWAACSKALELGLRYRQSADRGQFEALKKLLANARNYFTDCGATNIAAWVTATERTFDGIALLAEAEARLDPAERRTTYHEAKKRLLVAAQMFERAGYVVRKEDTLRYLQPTLEEETTVIAPSIPTAPIVRSVSELASQAVTQELTIGSDILSTPSLQAELSPLKAPPQVDRETGLSLTVLNMGHVPAILVRIENLGHPHVEFRSSSTQLPLSDGSLELRGKQLPPLGSAEFHFFVKPLKFGRHTLQPRVLAVSGQGELLIQPVPSLTLEVFDRDRPIVDLKSQGYPGHEREVRKREEVGLPPVDVLIYGGIPAGYAVILKAPPSDEARDLLRSFILSGLNSGEHVLCIARDPSLLRSIPKDKLPSLSVLSFGEPSEGIPSTVTAKLSNLTEVSIEIAKLIRPTAEFKQRACIDTLSDVLLQHGALSARKWASDLIRKLKANGFTILALLDNTLHEVKEVQAVVGVFDGEMEISERDSGRFLRVKRMYDTSHSSDWVLLK